MKIIHASIPADDPKRVAEVLAEIMEGQVMPFPPGGGDSWMAWAKDGKLELEIVRRGDVMHHGDEEAEWRAADDVQRLSEVHLAIGVDRPAAEIIEIAERAGWPARRCVRGAIFELVEVWVEGAFVLELFDPEQADHYERVVTPESWKQFLAKAA
jgi:hypothetical protein